MDPVLVFPLLHDVHGPLLQRLPEPLRALLLQGLIGFSALGLAKENKPNPPLQPTKKGGCNFMRKPDMGPRALYLVRSG